MIDHDEPTIDQIAEAHDCVQEAIDLLHETTEYLRKAEAERDALAEANAQLNVTLMETQLERDRARAAELRLEELLAGKSS